MAEDKVLNQFLNKTYHDIHSMLLDIKQNIGKAKTLPDKITCLIQNETIEKCYNILKNNEDIIKSSLNNQPKKPKKETPKNDNSN